MPGILTSPMISKIMVSLEAKYRDGDAGLQRFIQPEESAPVIWFFRRLTVKPF